MKMKVKDVFYAVILENEVCFADEPPAMAIYSKEQSANFLKEKLQSIFKINKYEVKKVELNIIDE